VATTERPYLSVVIPAYNEEARLAHSLPLIARYLTEQSFTAEIVVVDDGSTDGTAALAAQLLRGRGRVLRVPENRGKGHAVRHGVLHAEGRWVLFTDADLSAPIEEHAKLAAASRDHDLDLAIGSRAVEGSHVEGSRLLRRVMRRTFNRVIKLLTGLPFNDTQCGFKLLDRERLRPLFERMIVDGFAFDVELLFLCSRFGMRVQEVPIVWRNDPRTKVGVLVDPFRMVLDVARVRWRFRRGGYYGGEEAAGAGAGGSG
jgi:dolichyl-phosphate beta-glucosyltransferase